MSDQTQNAPDEATAPSGGIVSEVEGEVKKGEAYLIDELRKGITEAKAVTEEALRKAGQELAHLPGGTEVASWLNSALGHLDTALNSAHNLEPQAEEAPAPGAIDASAAPAAQQAEDDAALKDALDRQGSTGDEQPETQSETPASSTEEPPSGVTSESSEDESQGGDQPS